MKLEVEATLRLVGWREMRMGKWSEGRSGRVVQEEMTARDGLVAVMSGEVGACLELEGERVCNWASLRMVRGESWS